LGGGHRIARRPVIATIWAASYRQRDVAGGDKIVISGWEAMVVSIAALRTAQPEVSSFERIGHTAGRYAECFHNKCPEDEGQYKSGYQPFEGICDVSRSIFSLSSSFAGTGFFVLTCRHKNNPIARLARLTDGGLAFLFVI